VNDSHQQLRPAVLRARWAVCVVLLLLATASCGGSSASDEGDAQVAPSAPSDQASQAASGTIRLYTSYNQPEVDAVLAAYQSAEPDVQLEVFRAPTGQLTARIAAEERSGGVRGDVLLLSDPLSMQQYAAQDMLLTWTPVEEEVVPATARTDTFWGVTTSNVVVVHRPGAAPASWQDLTEPQYRDKVALPDPTFAGSAFGALGYFAFADGFGLDYYRQLKDNGAVQVQAPGDVIAGVAGGRFDAGMTLDFLARAAVANGSPIEIAAPDPGAVELYAPVGVFAATQNAAAAQSLAGFLLTRPAQEALAQLDRTPIRSDVPALAPPVPEVVPDWPQIFERQEQLLADYRSILGG
jgi:iron(III) transport system substrate-binding protein